MVFSSAEDRGWSCYATADLDCLAVPRRTLGQVSSFECVGPDLRLLFAGVTNNQHQLMCAFLVGCSEDGLDAAVVGYAGLGWANRMGVPSSDVTNDPVSPLCVVPDTTPGSRPFRRRNPRVRTHYPQGVR